MTTSLKTKWQRLKYWQKASLIGFMIGGILPGILHLFKMTVFASTTDFIEHIISAAIGALIGLIIGKTKKK